MRTRKRCSVFLVCLLCLLIQVQQCNLLALGLRSKSGSVTGRQVLTATTSLGFSAVQSAFMSLLSTAHLGFTTLHTMAISLAGGFVLGVVTLSGFIYFLLYIVPQEEYERSLGVAGETRIHFKKTFPLLNQVQRHILNSTLEPPLVHNNVTSFNVSSSLISSRRHKRSTLVNANATVVDSLEAIARVTNASSDDERIPRFLTSLVGNPRDCLPLLMCGLSAARKPNERTETVNDYAYLLKEFLDDVQDEEDKSEDDDSSIEDDLFVAGQVDEMRKKGNQFRSPMDFLNVLASSKSKTKKKDEVDEMIDQMRKEEDEKIEELALEEMADNPHDFKFALEDMKVRGLKKTMAKMPQDSRKKYIQKLMKEDSGEEEGEEGIEMEDDYEPMPMNFKGHSARHEYPGATGYQHFGRGGHYDYKGLVRGGYPPPPPLPPVPQYRSRPKSDELYKRNLNVLRGNLQSGPPTPPGFKRKKILVATKTPSRNSRKGGKKRQKRETVWSERVRRGALQKKRLELEGTNNIYDRARIAAEIGQMARSNRQCRAFFNACPGAKNKSKQSSSTKSKQTGASSTSKVNDDRGGGNHAEEINDEAPFLNRAVNNIRRVLLGPPPESSKLKRVHEIREVIQQLHPSGNHGGSEVKVVLNIGPAPIDPNQVNQGIGAPSTISLQPQIQQYAHQPPQQYMQPSQLPPFIMPPQYPPAPTPQQLGLPPPFSTQLVPNRPDQTTRYTVTRRPVVTTKRPSTTPKPSQSTTKKVMVYRNPSSTSASKKPLPPLFSVPSANLEQLLKATVDPVSNSDEEGATTSEPFDETTTDPVVFDDIIQDWRSGEENEEKSVEEELVLPTKYPMSKEEYAQNLRETFDIFNRFKEAHHTVPAPPTTAEASLKEATPTNFVRTKPHTSGTATSSPNKSGGTKGDTGDTQQGEVSGEEDRDIATIWENIKDTFKKLRKKGKKKKKKKKPSKHESSEESSEEEGWGWNPEYPPKPEPLVAVPHPDEVPKIRWRSGTQLFTDKFYHLFFGKRQVKPLPDKHADKHKKTPEHHLHTHSSSDEHSDEEHHDIKGDEIHYSEPDMTGPVIHHHTDVVKTADKAKVKKGPKEKPPTAKPNGNSRKKSGPVLLIATPAPKTDQANVKTNKKRNRTTTTPAPESEEDDNEDEEEIVEKKEPVKKSKKKKSKPTPATEEEENKPVEKVRKKKPTRAPETSEDESNEENEDEEHKPTQKGKKKTKTTPAPESPEDVNDDEEEEEQNKPMQKGKKKNTEATSPESLEDDNEEETDADKEYSDENSKEYQERGDLPQDESDEQYPHPGSRRLPTPPSSGSESYEDAEDEEEEQEDDKDKVVIKTPQLVFNPFTVVVSPKDRSGIGLENEDSDSAEKRGKRKKTQRNRQKENLNLPPVKIKFSDLFGKKNTTSLMHRSSLSSTQIRTTLKPKRKILKYKHG